MSKILNWPELNNVSIDLKTICRKRDIVTHLCLKWQMINRSSLQESLEKLYTRLKEIESLDK